MLEIGVARVRGARDDRVVATRTFGAGGRGVDSHDVTRRSRLGTGTMMDGVGDYDEPWHGPMARAEKVD